MESAMHLCTCTALRGHVECMESAAKCTYTPALLREVMYELSRFLTSCRARPGEVECSADSGLLFGRPACVQNNTHLRLRSGEQDLPILPDLARARQDNECQPRQCNQAKIPATARFEVLLYTCSSTGQPVSLTDHALKGAPAAAMGEKQAARPPAAASASLQKEIFQRPLCQEQNMEFRFAASIDTRISTIPAPVDTALKILRPTQSCQQETVPAASSF
eukprot:1162016-Pelagomonas_calceolata.AAC.25